MNKTIKNIRLDVHEITISVGTDSPMTVMMVNSGLKVRQITT